MEKGCRNHDDFLCSQDGLSQPLPQLHRCSRWASPTLPDEQGAAAAPTRAQNSNVILLTLDGVRWEEVFHGVDPGQSVDANPKVFEYLTGTLAKQGVLFGDKSRGETVRVANKPQNSLPGYQSIMAGATQPCDSNLCGRIQVETMQERLLHDLDLKPEQVVTIASWEKIANAVEHVEGTTLVNAGNNPLLIGHDPLNSEDAGINRKQTQDNPPWKDARWDKYTFAHAINYLKTKRPRFLYIALNDSDEWGHKGEYDKYLATLRQHDSWIKELVTTLDSMGEYGKNTTLIITTDHGRGDANDWNEHGAGFADSGNVWLFGRSPYTEAFKPKRPHEAASSVVFSHLDIRPTIEATFGLEPKLDGVTPPPGHVISAIVGRDGSRGMASTALILQALPSGHKADRSQPVSHP